MKKVSLFSLFSFSIFLTLAQTIEVKIDQGIGDASFSVKDGDEIKLSPKLERLNRFGLRSFNLTATDKLIIKVAGAEISAPGADEYLHTDAAVFKTFDFRTSIINSKVTIVKKIIGSGSETDLLSFAFIQTPDDPTDSNKINNRIEALEPLSDFLDRLMNGYKLTPQGWVIRDNEELSDKEKKIAENITHIFFDEFGNSLMGTMPQGVANRQYVAHIIYRGYSDKQGSTRYSLKQKSGSFSSGLSINNSGALKSLPAGLQSGTEEVPFDTWKEELSPLGIATDDLVFDIIATTVDDKNKPVKVILETQTIKMAPVYHASIDFGLINSQLQNPNYTLVEAPDGSGNKVLKESDQSPQGIVTVMATFYTSPIVILQRIFQRRLKKNIPTYKLTGRSFFDDHGLFERIYPTVGVSVSSKSFENLFFGLNWELARGLSIFGGGHWGKVNTFEMPGYIPGSSAVTQAEFDFYQNTKWKVAWAYGVKLDISIITNLFN